MYLKDLSVLYGKNPIPLQLLIFKKKLKKMI